MSQLNRESLAYDRDAGVYIDLRTIEIHQLTQFMRVSMFALPFIGIY